MTLAILILLAFVTPVLAASGIIWSRRVVLGEWLGGTGWPVRLSSARDALIATLGPVPAAVAILLAGLSAIALICWPLGTFVKLLEKPIDVPLFEWMQSQFPPTAPWTVGLTTLTQIGDLSTIAVIALVAAILFAFLWRRRGWWLPPLLLFVGVGTELVLQTMLKVVVGRGHPPTALGTFPSGGTARVIDVFGVILFLAFLTWPRVSRSWRAVGWTAVGLLGAVEAYTRFYLLQHWATDIPAGWLFGGLLLLVILASASALMKLETERQTMVTTTGPDQGRSNTPRSGARPAYPSLTPETDTPMSTAGESARSR